MREKKTLSLQIENSKRSQSGKKVGQDGERFGDLKDVGFYFGLVKTRHLCPEMQVNAL